MHVHEHSKCMCMSIVNACVISQTTHKANVVLSKNKTDTTIFVLFTPHTLNLKSASVWRHNRRLNLSLEFLHSYVNGTNIVLFRTFDCWYLLIPLAPFSVVWLIFKNFQALVFRKNQYKEWYAVASKFGNTLLICDQSMIFLFPVWLEKM